MTTPASAQSVSSQKSSLACASCSERKVRCDRQTPCSACVKHKVQCVYRRPKPSQRKRRYVINQLVEERLKHCEGILRKKGIDPDHLPDPPETEDRQSIAPESPDTVWQIPTPTSTASTVSGPQATIFNARLLRGQNSTKLLDNSLWSRVADEVYNAEDASDEESSNASDNESFNDDFAYVLGLKKLAHPSLHPPKESIFRLWQAFVENVNPLTKLVHVPSLQTAIEKAVTNIEQVPKGFEALMFAIYSTAVVSLPGDECMKQLGEDRTILLPRYVSATKSALSRAKFMSSTSIVVLQALVLHIVSIRDICEPRALWSLTGAAIRVAEGMGMRLDGTLLGLSPFETEMHRRIWWQLKMHDFRAAELSGQAKFRDFEIGDSTPKQPANVNDSDLYPTMLCAPNESTRPTEMIWNMIRLDLASFAAGQKVILQKSGKNVFSSDEYIAMDDLKRKDEFVEKLEDMLETKHLRFCDPSQPLQLLALIGARSAINLVRFLSHHPRRWSSPSQIPASEQQLVLKTALNLGEQFNMLQSNPQLRHFAWNVMYYIPWHAIIHILDTLRMHPFHTEAARAWLVINSFYGNNSEMLLSLNRPIWVAVGNLCLKAFSARVTASAKEGSAPIDPPEYVTRLREQREAAKARKEATVAKNREQKPLNHDTSFMTMDVNEAWANENHRPAPTENQPQQNLMADQSANPVLGTTRTGDDAFWLNDMPENGFFAGGMTGMMNQGTDAILAQGSWVETPSNEVIDWAQWDVWLGNLDPVRQYNGGGPG